MAGALQRKILRTIRRRRLFRARDSILVAVSGGPDSVALLATLVELGRAGWRIGIGHVNHGLRGRDSDRDERFVAGLAIRFGVAFHSLNGRLRGAANLEERAREIRYRRLLEVAAAHRYRRIAVAHTRDDQAETLLLRLARGAGSRGLAGMRFDRGDGVVRPMLECTRAEVLEGLIEADFGYRSDRSNRDPRFTRNRIRRRVLPMLERELNPRLRAALARTAELLADDDDHLEREARRQGRKVAGPAGLDAVALLRLPAAIRRRVVRQWLAVEREDSLAPSMEHIEAILQLAEGNGSKSISIPGASVRRRGDHLRFGTVALTNAPRDAALVPGTTVTFGGYRLALRRLPITGAPAPNTWRALFDARHFGSRDIQVRSPRPGDRLRPLGLGGSKKLQDLFVDAKLPREQRASHPVVVGTRAILWVPGLARSDLATVGARTRHVLVLECRPAEGA